MAANASFDPVRDFTHIAYLGGPPVLWIVHPEHPAKSYEEFLAWAKASPKPIDYIRPAPERRAICSPKVSRVAKTSSSSISRTRARAPR